MTPTDIDGIRGVICQLRERTEDGRIEWTPISNGDGGFRSEVNGYTFIINGMNGTFRAWGYLRATDESGTEAWTFDKELPRSDWNRFEEAKLVSAIAGLWSEIRERCAGDVNEKVRHSLDALTAA
jgi:hypothetical protein